MSLKTCAIGQILLNNHMLKVNNKSTKTRCEISPSLTIINNKNTDGVFGSFLLTQNEF